MKIFLYTLDSQAPDSRWMWRKNQHLPFIYQPMPCSLLCFRENYNHYGACAIQEEEEVTLTGGSDKIKYIPTPNSAGPMKKVTRFRKDGTRENLPDMNKRRYNHACGYFIKSDETIVRCFTFDIFFTLKAFNSFNVLCIKDISRLCTYDGGKS